MAVPWRFSWIDAAGSELMMDGSAGIACLDETLAGLYMPPVSLSSYAVPDQPGERLRSVTVGPRVIDLALLLKTQDGGPPYALMAQLTRKMSPLRGADGYFRVYAPSGEVRQVACRYMKGLEGEEGRGRSGGDWMKTPASLWAGQPFWEPTADTLSAYALATTPTPFLPIPPMIIYSSTVFAAPTITNPGDVWVWPRWTIRGPGSDVTLLNTSSGKSLRLVIDIAEGGLVLIDTRPERKTLLDGNGQNLYPYLDPSTVSELWPLEEGANAIQVEIGAATSDTLVTLAWRPRYLTPPEE